MKNTKIQHMGKHGDSERGETKRFNMWGNSEIQHVGETWRFNSWGNTDIYSMWAKHGESARGETLRFSTWGSTEIQHAKKHRDSAQGIQHVVETRRFSAWGKRRFCT